jgi:hypothetical protein
MQPEVKLMYAPLLFVLKERAVILIHLSTRTFKFFLQVLCFCVPLKCSILICVFKWSWYFDKRKNLFLHCSKGHTWAWLPAASLPVIIYFVCFYVLVHVLTLVEVFAAKWIRIEHFKGTQKHNTWRKNLNVLVERCISITALSLSTKRSWNTNLFNH